MRQVPRKDTQMGKRPALDQLLVPQGVEGQFLDVYVAAAVHETLAPLTLPYQ